VVDSLDQLASVMPAIRQLGRRHAAHGVRPEHYATVGEALIWTLEQGLSADFTPATLAGPADTRGCSVHRQNVGLAMVRQSWASCGRQSAIGATMPSPPGRHPTSCRSIVWTELASVRAGSQVESLTCAIQKLSSGTRRHAVPFVPLITNGFWLRWGFSGARIDRVRKPMGWSRNQMGGKRYRWAGLICLSYRP
jgi:hypothetical protein